MLDSVMHVYHHQERLDIDSKMNEAEVYYDMGLLSASLDLYEHILPLLDGQDAVARESVENRIFQLRAEIDEKEEKTANDTSSESLSMVKDELSRHENIQAVFDSASTLMELDLCVEALSEYEKLIALEYPLEKIIPEITRCLLKIYSPVNAAKKMETLIRDHRMDRYQCARVELALGKEFEKRHQKRLAYDLYRAAKKSAPEDSEIKERLEALVAGFSTGSKYDFLLKRGIVHTKNLQQARMLSKRTKKSVEYHLLENFGVRPEDLGKSLSGFFSCPFRSYDAELPAPLILLDDLKLDLLLHERWVPLGFRRGDIEILTDDPRDLRKTERIRNLLQTKRICFSVGTIEDIGRFIKKFSKDKYGDEKGDRQALLDQQSPYQEGNRNARDKRWEARYTPRVPDFVWVEFSLDDDVPSGKSYRLDVMNYSICGLGLLIGEHDVELLQMLQPGDQIKNICFFASWAIMKVDARVVHITPIGEGKYRGNHLMGLDLNDTLEGFLSQDP